MTDQQKEKLVDFARDITQRVCEKSKWRNILRIHGDEVSSEAYLVMVKVFDRYPDITNSLNGHWPKGALYYAETELVASLRRLSLLPKRKKPKKVKPRTLTNWNWTGEDEERKLETDGGFAEIERVENTEYLMGRLDEKERKIVRMRFWEGCSCTAVAAAFGKSYGWAERELERILSKLKEALE